MNDYEHNLGDEAAIKAYRKDQAERAKAERQQIKEVDAKEEAYRKKHNIGPEVKGYQHMIAAEAEEKAAQKNAALMQEGLRRAAEEGDRQRAAEKERDDKAKAERKAKRDETAKRNSADTYRTQISQQAFDFSAPNPKGGSKGPSGGGGSGGMGTGKMNRDISKNMKKGGKVSSASKRADGCAVKGKTRGRIV
jgi:membrane protein involved in colicin uptake